MLIDNDGLHDCHSLPAILRRTEIRRGIFIIIGNECFTWCADVIDALMIFRSQSDVQRAKLIGEMVKRSCTENGAGNTGFGETPCQRQLAERTAYLMLNKADSLVVLYVPAGDSTSALPPFRASIIAATHYACGSVHPGERLSAPSLAGETRQNIGRIP